MFYFYLSLLLLAVHTFLVFTTNFSLHPEFSLFPYLVQKGLMPYRDFFDHHGFLTYYILAPLSFDTSFFSYKLFYYLIQSVNLILVLKVLQTSRSKTVYTILGLLYVLINYYFQFDKLIILRQYIVENYRREKEFEDFILMSN